MSLHDLYLFYRIMYSYESLVLGSKTLGTNVLEL